MCAFTLREYHTSLGCGGSMIWQKVVVMAGCMADAHMPGLVAVALFKQPDFELSSAIISSAANVERRIP